MKKVIGIIIRISREIANEHFEKEEDMHASTANVSSISENPLQIKFYDQNSEKLYLHFQEPVKKDLLNDYFSEEEMIFEVG